MEQTNESRESAEFSARSVDEALKQAAERFGVAVADLQYEVLRDSTRSILGLVRTGEVTIRVTAPTRAASAPAKQAAAQPAATEAADADEALDDDEFDDDEFEDDQEYDEDEEEEDDDAELVEDLRRNPPELEALASEVVATLLDKMGVLAAVEVVDRGGIVEDDSGDVSPLMLNLVGDDLGLLIGRRGETLRDLQFITRLIISRKLKVWPNIVIDVEGYKARRVEHLESLAERMADQVRRTGQPVTLEPMPAHERRIIHLTLRDDQDVYTESVGQDDRRKVQILPR